MAPEHAPNQIKDAIRAAVITLGMTLVFEVCIFWSVTSMLKGAYAAEVIAILIIGLIGGGLIRVFLPEKVVTSVFLALVVVEGIVLCQFPLPWSGLWMVFIPANAFGVMAGGAIRNGIADIKPRPKDVWIVNGTEEKLKDSAQRLALESLASWDSAKSGRFFVERNDGLFEAVGNPATGFIVHCSASFRDNDEWQMLGSVDQSETVIQLPSGPAHIPAGAVTDLENTGIALRGFFHHRGPDPQLTWSSGIDVMDLRFG